VNSEKRVGTLEHEADVAALCAIRNGEQLAVKLTNERINIWDPYTRCRIKTLSCSSVEDRTANIDYVFKLSEWGPDHLVCVHCYRHTLDVFEIGSGKIVKHHVGPGKVLNKDILMLRPPQWSLGGFRPPSSVDFVNHDGELLFTFVQNHGVSSLIELLPGTLAIIYHWEVLTLGPKDLSKQQLEVWQFGPTRYF